MSTKLIMKKIITLFSVMLLFIGCINEEEPTYYNVEMRVESQGEFKVWWNYTGNPDANETWLAQPPILHQNIFKREFALKEQDFYKLKIYPVDNTEFTVTILVNGNVRTQETSNEITVINESVFHP